MVIVNSFERFGSFCGLILQDLGEILQLWLKDGNVAEIGFCVLSCVLVFLEKNNLQSPEHLLMQSIFMSNPQSNFMLISGFMYFKLNMLINQSIDRPLFIKHFHIKA